MKCRACDRKLPEGRTGRFCSERCRRQFDGAGAGSVESGAPRNPAPDHGQAIRDAPPLTADELRRANEPSRSFTAKRSGWCQRCFGAITPGQEIQFQGVKKLVHVECPARREDAA